MLSKAKSVLFLASSLCDGLEDNNIRQVTTLLSNKDADPNVLIPTHGVTPFHLVIGNDSIEFTEEVTKLFLRHGGDPNVRSNDGMTPVHVAAAWGRVNILQLLLANGGDPLCLDNDGRSPFHYAFDGKYFKAVTMLAKYCENIREDEDDEPKFNTVLDKIIVTSRDLVAEYVASKDTTLRLSKDSISKNNAFPKFDTHNPNFSPMTVESKHVPDTRSADKIKCESLNSTNEAKDASDVEDINVECSSVFNDTTSEWNNLSNTGDKETSYHSFINLDRANLNLSDVMKKEKCLVSKIINHLSTTLASDRTVNKTLPNHSRNKREGSSTAKSSSDVSPELKENTDPLYEYKCKSLKDFASKLEHNLIKEDNLKPSTPLTGKQRSKYNIRNNCKRRYREISNRIPLPPTCTLDNSIVSMSPNFNTPNDRKRKNTVKTPSISSRYRRNDSIVSKSPNFATPVHRYKDRKKGKTSSINGYSSTKTYLERKAEARFFDINRYEKERIAQSTPRRKRRSMYKLYSSSKKFDFCQQEDDITADEFTVPYTLKPVNLDKTIFSEEAIENASCNNTLYSGNAVTSSLNHEEPLEMRQRDFYGKHLAIKLDKRKYDKDITIYSDANIDFTRTDVDSNNSTRMEKGNNSLDSDKNSTEFENRTRMPFVKIHHGPLKTKYLCTDTTMESTHAIESTKLYRKNFVDRSNGDTKKKMSNKHPDKNIGIEDNINRERAEDTFKTNYSNARAIEENSSLLSYVTAREEYKYEDPEKGVILLERRVRIVPSNSSSERERDIENKLSMSRASSASTIQNLPKESFFVDNAALRRELTQLGDQPGPITSTTRQVYLKHLMRLRSIKDTSVVVKPIPQNIPKNHTEQNNRTKPHLEFGTWVKRLDTYKALEEHVFREFVSSNPSRRWREGISKTSFTYLLLDPRVTQNLPYRSTNLVESEVWSIFLNAIFYIGKGKRSRPFAHLYDAFNTWVSKIPAKTNKKIDHILDIWNNDRGVICLHVFQNVIPVEAYTREAAMIDALGTEWLGNCKSGEYYGIAATWSPRQKQEFGRYLLYEASRILLHEGERELFPQNL